jgi:hypothetical protein
VLRNIFGPKRNEVTGEWRKLCNEELHDLYSSPNKIRIIKSRRTKLSRRMKLSGHVARIKEKRGAYRLFMESQKERTTRKSKG